MALSQNMPSEGLPPTTQRLTVIPLTSAPSKATTTLLPTLSAVTFGALVMTEMVAPPPLSSFTSFKVSLPGTGPTSTIRQHTQSSMMSWSGGGVPIDRCSSSAIYSRGTAPRGRPCGRRLHRMKAPLLRVVVCSSIDGSWRSRRNATMYAARSPGASARSWPSTSSRTSSGGAAASTSSRDRTTSPSGGRQNLKARCGRSPGASSDSSAPVTSAATSQRWARPLASRRSR
mmetsp:Transcript_6729/g.23596  ORF Transcript_6729/g.23596 Transcript_6729/m.23596 type:complete len:230 (-) Transcript_6729:351-1040(-)